MGVKKKKKKKKKPKNPKVNVNHDIEFRWCKNNGVRSAFLPQRCDQTPRPKVFFFVFYALLQGKDYTLIAGFFFLRFIAIIVMDVLKIEKLDVKVQVTAA